MRLQTGLTWCRVVPVSVAAGGLLYILVYSVEVCYTMRVVKRTCTAAPRFLRYEREVMHMSNTELLSILLSIASLLLTLYFGLR